MSGLRLNKNNNILFDSSRLLDSNLVLTPSDNCALSMVPVAKRTEKERKRKRLKPTLSGRIDRWLRIMDLVRYHLKNRMNMITAGYVGA